MLGMDQVFVVRHKVIVEGPAQREWPKVFGEDKKLTTALLDRLALHAAVITTTSARLTHRAC